MLPKASIKKGKMIIFTKIGENNTYICPINVLSWRSISTNTNVGRILDGMNGAYTSF